MEIDEKRGTWRVWDNGEVVARFDSEKDAKAFVKEGGKEETRANWYGAEDDTILEDGEQNMAVRKRKTASRRKKPVPTNKKLYARVKAEAKRKFRVYPSAYANGWLVRTYKARGGKYRMGQ